MTAPFPTRAQEEWRYADLDALKPVWSDLADVATIVVGPGDPEGLNIGTSSLLLRGRYGFHQPWRQAPTATRTKSVPKPRTSPSRIPASMISFLTARPQIRISSMTT